MTIKALHLMSYIHAHHSGSIQAEHDCTQCKGYQWYMLHVALRTSYSSGSAALWFNDCPIQLYLQAHSVQRQQTCNMCAPQKHYSEKEAAELMRCLVEFLAFMHSKGLMHRDLKPENILLSNHEKDAVMKIGTSDFCPDGHRLFHIFGTPLYVAPEVSF